MLLDNESFDLVQHVDTVLSAAQNGELTDRIGPELMQSVVEISTPVCKGVADVDAELRKLRGLVSGIAGERGMRVGSAGHASLQPLRAPADHRPRPLPKSRRPAPVRRAPRAHLRPPHPRGRGRPREGDQGDERAPPPSPGLPRPLRQLAVLARRGDRARVEPADGLRRLSALRAAAALPRLRRLRGGRRPAREDRLHRGLHAHLVGHPPPSALRDDRGARHGRGHAAWRRRSPSPPTCRPS